ncbi:alternate-type signal peptide domain-containing protein [Microbacterium sp. dk485]|uniref:Alternate-type signal peptide domain-containing protein n=2 Tax=Microbacteriaceae TaxID=85023 RepID=A0ABX5SN86_9MICO|nr:alternate-type signal peptide domain-containing protein [Microbacterium wangchenii]TFV84323.1 alternate-type signal peptide domain-containing protein [Microbacterium sp. dk485]TXK15864.1 alternate-type signal peptide domain-containing protein [Microbacterium wangchenii]
MSQGQPVRIGSGTGPRHPPLICGRPPRSKGHPMKKFVKASIATAAGVTLLLGGAGTFASWNASATTAGATIASGNMVVEDSGVAGVWTANGSTIDLASYAIAPGDVLTYSKTMSVSAEGDSIQATLGLTGGSIAAADATDASDQALAGYLQEGATLTASGEGISGTGPTFTVAPGSGVVDEDVTVTVSIAFPAGDTAGGNNDAMGGAVNLSDLTVTLTQNTN